MSAPSTVIRRDQNNTGLEVRFVDTMYAQPTTYFSQSGKTRTVVGEVVCSIHNRFGKRLAQGIARCSSDEASFRVEEGRAIAFGRAVERLPKLVRGIAWRALQQ